MYRFTKQIKYILFLLVVISVFAFAFSQKSHAETSYTCFPTCSTIDSRMISAAGGGMGSMDNLTYSFGFGAPKGSSTLEIGIFDGDSGKDNTGNINQSGGNWDSTTVQLEYTLYADSLGNGTDTEVIGQWYGNADNGISGPLWTASSTGMSNNDWWNLTVQTSNEAKSPSGNFFYTLVIKFEGTSPSGLSAIKLRTDKSLYVNTESIGLIGMSGTINDIYILYPEFSGDWNNMGPTTYDGFWNLYFDSFASSSNFIVWDGDFDYGPTALEGDTDDLDTPNDILPPWVDSGGALLEGAQGQGAPADDFGGVLFRRTPNVRYTITTSEGETYFNSDPSGNSEWEQFRIETDSEILADYHRDNLLLSGIYTMGIEGLDVGNTSFLKSSYKMVGMKEDGSMGDILRPFNISGSIFLDKSKDGIKSSGETGISGVSVSLLDSNEQVILTTHTDTSGDYTFEVEGLNLDKYTSEVIYDGEYEIKVDDTNFASGGSLYNFITTTPEADRTHTVTNNNSEGEVLGYAWDDNTPPTGTISINTNSTYTNTPVVTLVLSANDNLSGVSQMMISNTSDFTGASWENYATTKQWTLPSGDGEKTVYVKFKDNAGNESTVVSDTIILKTTTILTLDLTNLTYQETQEVYTKTVGEEVIVKGTAEQNTKVTITALTEEGVVVYETELTVGEDGEWELDLGSVLGIGTYLVQISTTDPAGNVAYSEFTLGITEVPEPLPATGENILAQLLIGGMLILSSGVVLRKKFETNFPSF